jgi:alpha-L-fucosidase
MATNREAIVGSRPWEVAATSTSTGTEVRFTQRAGRVYALLMDTPVERTLVFDHIDGSGVSEVRLLGVTDSIEWEIQGRSLSITMPERLPDSAVYAFDLGTGLRPSASPAH